MRARANPLPEDKRQPLLLLSVRYIISCVVTSACTPGPPGRPCGAEPTLAQHRPQPAMATECDRQSAHVAAAHVARYHRLEPHPVGIPAGPWPAGADEPAGD